MPIEQKSVNPFLSTPTGVSINEIADNLKSKNIELPSDDSKKNKDTKKPGKKKDDATSYLLLSGLMGDNIARRVAVKPSINIPSDKKNLGEKVEQITEKVDKVESVVRDRKSVV